MALNKKFMSRTLYMHVYILYMHNVGCFYSSYSRCVLSECSQPTKVNMVNYFSIVSSMCKCSKASFCNFFFFLFKHRCVYRAPDKVHCAVMRDNLWGLGLCGIFVYMGIGRASWERPPRQQQWLMLFSILQALIRWGWRMWCHLARNVPLCHSLSLSWVWHIIVTQQLKYVHRMWMAFWL